MAEQLRAKDEQIAQLTQEVAALKSAWAAATQAFLPLMASGGQRQRQPPRQTDEKSTPATRLDKKSQERLRSLKRDCIDDLITRSIGLAIRSS